MHPRKMAMAMSAVLFCSVTSAAGAAPEPELREQLGRCAVMEKAEERLSCYDRLAGRTDRPVATATSDSVNAGHAMPRTEDRQPARESASKPDRVAEPPATGPEAAFGIETLPVQFDDQEEAVDRIETTITVLSSRPRGEYIFVLANGQRWTQLESGRARYREGQAVTIERTTLGAYMLSTEHGRASRVRRLD